MNESVELAAPELMRNSLTLTGLTFRTFSTVVSDCSLPLSAFIHDALPTRSPFKASGPDVTLNVALTLAPFATGPANVFELSEVPKTTAVHCFGTEILNRTSLAAAPVVLVNVTVVSCDDPGERVWRPGGAVSEGGARVNGNTLYPAATMLACTCWSVASVGKVPAAVIAPS